MPRGRKLASLTLTDHKPSASGDGASARPVSRACTTNSDPVGPGPMTTTRWRR